jgi:hypothetical protein
MQCMHAPQSRLWFKKRKIRATKIANEWMESVVDTL